MHLQEGHSSPSILNGRCTRNTSVPAVVRTSLKWMQLPFTVTGQEKKERKKGKGHMEALKWREKRKAQPKTCSTRFPSRPMILPWPAPRTAHRLPFRSLLKSRLPSSRHRHSRLVLSLLTYSRVSPTGISTSAPASAICISIALRLYSPPHIASLLLRRPIQPRFAQPSHRLTVN